MIRRAVEYIIGCDSERFGIEDCPNLGNHAFCDHAAADCAASARKHGWAQVSAKLWLCPRCVQRLPADVRRRLAAESRQDQADTHAVALQDTR